MKTHWESFPLPLILTKPLSALLPQCAGKPVKACQMFPSSSSFRFSLSFFLDTQLLHGCFAPKETSDISVPSCSRNAIKRRRVKLFVFLSEDLPDFTHQRIGQTVCVRASVWVRLAANVGELNIPAAALLLGKGEAMECVSSSLCVRYAWL